MSYKQLNKQTGVALIFIMVIFSLITVLAAKIVTNIRLETERTSHLLMRQQAKQYAYSAEQLVAELLRADKENDERNKAVKDHYFEAWHYQQEELKIDTGDIGKIEIDVFDLQGFINLNSLAATGSNNNNQPPGGNPSNTPGGNNPGNNQKGSPLNSKVVLEKLLSLQGIETNKAKQIVSQIVDWVDTNQQVSSGGAEDDDYLLGDNPYRTANDQMVSVSELMLLANMDYKIYRKLAPFVTVIPAASGDTKINVNTAPIEIFQALIEGLDKRSAENLVKARGKEGFKKIDDFTGHQILAGKGDKLPKGSLDIKSDYFKAVIKTKFADAEYYLVSYFHRSPKQGVSVISRQEGQPLIRLAKPKVKKD
ncbi:type II secretion system minor pseudopilin GspK [Spartinivicinus poritis]|uniref:Type II secretion system protein K n=1 Tax=Spartinivicinus poritis TaxID=2994640 RepID=A0ABT5UF35_9GAMM|nr:type II secretion system minor pseudopilin GspK [Spartinivicinus sp. A2-2]MDE1465003.1 type II secretion system minor pseudopilin GspK [Spartinivicinus sp. A2-2]